MTRGRHDRSSPERRTIGPFERQFEARWSMEQAALMMTCYDDAMRTIIDLPGDQLDALDGICRRESISRAEAIRRAVDLLVRDRAAGASRAAFGLWRGSRAVDGLAYQERLRREWGPATADKPVSRSRPRDRRTKNR